MNRLLRARRGLTLVEVMVSIAILVVMSAIIVESLRSSIEFHNLLENRDSTVRGARVSFSKLRRDLQLAYLTPNRAIPDRFQTVFVGLDEEPDRLYFASLNHQRLYLNSREADMTEITVWAERNAEGPGYTLFHRESALIDGEPDEDGVVWPLAYNVRSFRLRYLDQMSGEWREEWDTRSADTPYRLPRAVEIGLVLIAQDPEDPTGERTVDVPFLATVQVEYAPRLPGPNAAVGSTSAGGGGLPGQLPPGMASNAQGNQGNQGSPLPGQSGGGFPPGFAGGGGGGFGGGGFGGLPGGAGLGGLFGGFGGGGGGFGGGGAGPGAGRPAAGGRPVGNRPIPGRPGN